jgi:serine/threonine protein phosphatase PrpC
MKSTQKSIKMPAMQFAHAHIGSWYVASASVTGLRHHQENGVNEDSVAWREMPHGALSIAVADGVSGGAAGWLASSTAVQWCTHTPCENWDIQALDAAVHTAVSNHTNGKRGATTLVAASLKPEGCGTLLHVGDCRIYQWHCATEELVALTQDQTFLKLGEIPPSHVPAENPARMLGLLKMGNVHCQANYKNIELAEGDILLLCSDGLHGYLHDYYIWRAVKRNPQCLPRLSRRLLQAALDFESDDDISVLLLQFSPSEHEHEKEISP